MAGTSLAEERAALKKLLDEPLNTKAFPDSTVPGMEAGQDDEQADNEPYVSKLMRRYWGGDDDDDFVPSLCRPLSPKPPPPPKPRVKKKVVIKRKMTPAEKADKAKRQEDNEQLRLWGGLHQHYWNTAINSAAGNGWSFKAKCDREDQKILDLFKAFCTSPGVKKPTVTKIKKMIIAEQPQLKARLDEIEDGEGGGKKKRRGKGNGREKKNGGTPSDQSNTRKSGGSKGGGGKKGGRSSEGGDEKGASGDSGDGGDKKGGKEDGDDKKKGDKEAEKKGGKKNGPKKRGKKEPVDWSNVEDCIEAVATGKVSPVFGTESADVQDDEDSVTPPRTRSPPRPATAELDVPVAAFSLKSAMAGSLGGRSFGCGAARKKPPKKNIKLPKRVPKKQIELAKKISAQLKTQRSTPPKKEPVKKGKVTVATVLVEGSTRAGSPPTIVDHDPYDRFGRLCYGDSRGDSMLAPGCLSIDPYFARVGAVKVARDTCNAAEPENAFAVHESLGKPAMEEPAVRDEAAKQIAVEEGTSKGNDPVEKPVPEKEKEADGGMEAADIAQAEKAPEKTIQQEKPEEPPQVKQPVEKPKTPEKPRPNYDSSDDEFFDDRPLAERLMASCKGVDPSVWQGLNIPIPPPPSPVEEPASAEEPVNDGPDHVDDAMDEEPPLMVLEPEEPPPMSPEPEEPPPMLLEPEEQHVQPEEIPEEPTQKTTRKRAAKKIPAEAEEASTGDEASKPPAKKRRAPRGKAAAKNSKDVEPSEKPEQPEEPKKKQKAPRKKPGVSAELEAPKEVSKGASRRKTETAEEHPKRGQRKRKQANEEESPEPDEDVEAPASPIPPPVSDAEPDDFSAPDEYDQFEPTLRDLKEKIAEAPGEKVESDPKDKAPKEVLVEDARGEEFPEPCSEEQPVVEETSVNLANEHDYSLPPSSADVSMAEAPGGEPPGVSEETPAVQSPNPGAGSTQPQPNEGDASAPEERLGGKKRSGSSRVRKLLVVPRETMIMAVGESLAFIDEIQETRSALFTGAPPGPDSDGSDEDERPKRKKPRRRSRSVAGADRRACRARPASPSCQRHETEGTDRRPRRGEREADSASDGPDQSDGSSADEESDQGSTFSFSRGSLAHLQVQVFDHRENCCFAMDRGEDDQVLRTCSRALALMQRNLVHRKPSGPVNTFRFLAETLRRRTVGAFVEELGGAERVKLQMPPYCMSAEGKELWKTISHRLMKQRCPGCAGHVVRPPLRVTQGEAPMIRVKTEPAEEIELKFNPRPSGKQPDPYISSGELGEPEVPAEELVSPLDTTNAEETVQIPRRPEVESRAGPANVEPVNQPVGRGVVSCRPGASNVEQAVQPVANVSEHTNQPRDNHRNPEVVNGRLGSTSYEQAGQPVDRQRGQEPVGDRHRSSDPEEANRPADLHREHGSVSSRGGSTHLEHTSQPVTSRSFLEVLASGLSLTNPEAARQPRDYPSRAVSSGRHASATLEGMNWPRDRHQGSEVANIDRASGVVHHVPPVARRVGEGSRPVAGSGVPPSQPGPSSSHAPQPGNSGRRGIERPRENEQDAGDSSDDGVDDDVVFEPERTPQELRRPRCTDACCRHLLDKERDELIRFWRHERKLRAIEYMSLVLTTQAFVDYPIVDFNGRLVRGIIPDDLHDELDQAETRVRESRERIRAYRLARHPVPRGNDMGASTRQPTHGPALPTQPPRNGPEVHARVSADSLSASRRVRRDGSELLSGLLRGPTAAVGARWLFARDSPATSTRPPTHVVPTSAAQAQRAPPPVGSPMQSTVPPPSVTVGSNLPAAGVLRSAGAPGEALGGATGLPGSARCNTGVPVARESTNGPAPTVPRVVRSEQNRPVEAAPVAPDLVVTGPAATGPSDVAPTSTVFSAGSRVNSRPPLVAPGRPVEGASVAQIGDPRDIPITLTMPSAGIPGQSRPAPQFRYPAPVPQFRYSAPIPQFQYPINFPSASTAPPGSSRPPGAAPAAPVTSIPIQLATPTGSVAGLSRPLGSAPMAHVSPTAGTPKVREGRDSRTAIAMSAFGAIAALMSGGAGRGHRPPPPLRPIEIAGRSPGMPAEEPVRPDRVPQRPEGSGLGASGGIAEQGAVEANSAPSRTGDSASGEESNQGMAQELRREDGLEAASSGVPQGQGGTVGNYYHKDLQDYAAYLIRIRRGEAVDDDEEESVSDENAGEGAAEGASEQIEEPQQGDVESRSVIEDLSARREDPLPGDASTPTQPQDLTTRVGVRNHIFSGTSPWLMENAGIAFENRVPAHQAGPSTSLIRLGAAVPPNARPQYLNPDYFASNAHPAPAPRPTETTARPEDLFGRTRNQVFNRDASARAVPEGASASRRDTLAHGQNERGQAVARDTGHPFSWSYFPVHALLPMYHDAVVRHRTRGRRRGGRPGPVLPGAGGYGADAHVESTRTMLLQQFLLDAHALAERMTHDELALSRRQAASWGAPWMALPASAAVNTQPVQSGPNYGNDRRNTEGGRSGVNQGHWDDYASADGSSEETDDGDESEYSDDGESEGNDDDQYDTNGSSGQQQAGPSGNGAHPQNANGEPSARPRPVPLNGSWHPPGPWAPPMPVAMPQAPVHAAAPSFQQVQPQIHPPMHFLDSHLVRQPAEASIPPARLADTSHSGSWSGQASHTHPPGCGQSCCRPDLWVRRRQ